MKNKNFIRLNTNDQYLSLGNVFRIIKEESVNKNFFQADLFGLIFNAEDIADSTVNNYCTGLRPINPIYKNYFKSLKELLKNDSKVFIPMIKEILILLDDTGMPSDEVNLKHINSNQKLKNVCERLYSISKNDADVSLKRSSELFSLLENNDLYNFIINVLSYVILEKKQPILYT